jgi:tight adherence protein B
MPQSVSAAASDGSGPVERQVRRALAEVKVGLTIDEALMRVAQRMGSDDLRWAIAALQIQREVGGNLAKILDTAAGTIRARDDLRREIATLSAEGRISAYVLVALPIGIFLFMMMGRRDYVEIFWTTGIGKLMLFGFTSAVGVGWFWIRKLVVVEV